MPTIIRTHRVIAFTVMITLSAIFFQAHGIPETLALEQSEDLSLWRGKVKNILMDYIYDVSTPGSKDFIPSKDRIAVFDMDGTLMSERPHAFVFDAAIRYLVLHKTELSSKGPLYKDLCEAAEKSDFKYLRNHLNETFVMPFEGKTYAFYRNWCLKVFETEINPLKDRPQKNLVYKPMIELIDLLHERGFQVYVVSGSLQFAIMAISEKYLHVDESRCIGSMVQARAKKDGDRIVFVRGKIQPPPNVNSGKAIRIMMRTGQAPVLAFGNSSGDTWMLEFTASSPYRHMAFVLDHDDPREFVYHKPELLQTARAKNWVVISMKENFKAVYGE